MFSISNVCTIWKREMKGYFYTPLAWVFIGVFTLFMSFMFGAFLNLYQQYTMASITGQAQTITIDRLSEAFYANMHVLLLFFLPILSVKGICDESRQNTLALLFSSPVKTIDIVLAKILGPITILAVLLGMSFIFPTFLFIYAKDGKPDVWIILSTYLGLMSAGSFYLVFGVLFSSLTDTPLIAVVLSYMFNFGCWLTSLGSQGSSGTLKAIFEQASINDHFQSFAKGAPELKGIVFIFSVILLGVFLTHKSVDSRSWRS